VVLPQPAARVQHQAELHLGRLHIRHGEPVDQLPDSGAAPGMGQAR